MDYHSLPQTALLSLSCLCHFFPCEAEMESEKLHLLDHEVMSQLHSDKRLKH